MQRSNLPSGSDIGGPDLRTNFLKSRIAKLPHLPSVAPGSSADLGARAQMAPPYGADDDDHEAEEEEAFGSFPCKSASTSSSGASPKSLGNRRRHLARDDWSPLTAEGCFEEALEVDVEYPVKGAPGGEQGAEGKGKGTFRVYYTPPAPAVTRNAARPEKPSAPAAARKTPDLVSETDLLSLQPTAIADEDDISAAAASKSRPSDEDPGTVFVLIHGAGFSALSWALMAKEITKLSNGEAGVLAMDCRGHGRTKHQDFPKPLDMSLESLTADAIGVLRAMFPAPQRVPNLVLVGHSMGGSVAVFLAHALLPQSSTTPKPIPDIRISGVAVLDVVEGTAMEALVGMEGIVKAQPRGFASVEQAIRWHVEESNTIQNRDSARRSVPPLVVPNPEYQSGSAAVRDQDEAMEEVRDEESEAAAPSGGGESVHEADPRRYPYIWRADLLSTAPYWTGWFQHLSTRFLSVKCARLLLLAGTDRLDKDLMIGQMQGKYQLVVYQDVGHCLQEDAPARTAVTLVDFWRRNQTLNITRMIPGQSGRQDVRLNKVGQ